MKTAGLAWGLFLLGLLLYELYALTGPAPTLSAWVWVMDAKYMWFRWLVLGGVSFLMWHFFWQPRNKS